MSREHPGGHRDPAPAADTPAAGAAGDARTLPIAPEPTPSEPPAPGLSRRAMLEMVALTTLAAACDRSPAVVQKARQAAGAAAAAKAAGTAAAAPTFFTPHEWETVHLLVDYVIPRDDRSGSATDAGVPAFMDFMLSHYDDMQLPMRGGLAWLNAESLSRFGLDFVHAADAQRRALLDDIAWPKRAKPALSQGVAFFNRFRDLTASGFWTTEIGVKDLQYLGNQVVPHWDGCPAPALKKLGVSY